MIVQSDETILVKIGKRNDKEIVDPRKLFKAPVNYGFRHRNVEEKRAQSIVFGRVYLRLGFTYFLYFIVKIEKKTKQKRIIM